MNEPTLPLTIEGVSIDSIPAVIDDIERRLAEARTLPEVTAIRDKAEALRLYAKRRGAAIEAQNGCARVVFLAERQIGAALAKGQEAGEVAKRGRPAKNSTASRISEVGLTFDQAADYQHLAKAPNGVIDKAVSAANTECRPVTKADLRRAVEEAIGFKDPRPTPKEAKRRAKELQAQAAPGVTVAVPDNTGRYQVAESNQRDYQDRPAWFEIMRGIEVLGEPLLPVERIDELTPDYRLELTLGQGRRALVHLSALIKLLEARSDDEAA